MGESQNPALHPHHHVTSKPNSMSVDQVGSILVVAVTKAFLLRLSATFPPSRSSLLQPRSTPLLVIGKRLEHLQRSFTEILTDFLPFQTCLRLSHSPTLSSRNMCRTDRDNRSHRTTMRPSQRRRTNPPSICQSLLQSTGKPLLAKTGLCRSIPPDRTSLPLKCQSHDLTGTLVPIALAVLDTSPHSHPKSILVS